MLVVDASIVVDWVQPSSDPEGAARRALRRWVADRETLLAPRLLHEEVANALVTGIRRGRWSGVDADACFARLRALPVQLADVPADLDRAYELSRRYDEHPVYDLLYVALAERTSCRLFTADEKLVRRLTLLAHVQLLT